MGCTVREKHVRPNRKIRPVPVSKPDSCCLKNLVYHPGLTDSSSSSSRAFGLSSLPNPNNKWDYCTEEKLEEKLLRYLEALYHQTIDKLVTLGYEEHVALRAVLCNGHCYGDDSDVSKNVLNNTLSYLSSGGDEDDTGAGFADLRELEEYSLAGMIYLLQQVKVGLSKGDAMWCLVMSELHVGRASCMDVLSSRGSKGEGSVDLSGIMAPALCRFHGTWDFGDGGGPEFSGNGFSRSGGDELKLLREIDCPRRFNLSPAMKALLKRNVAAFAAGFRASMKQKEVQGDAGGNGVSCTDIVAVESSEQLRIFGSEESVSSVLEKFRDLNLDDGLESEGEDGVIVSLLHQVKDLEKKLKDRKEWAQKKAMQAAQKVSDELAELKSLSSEREGIQLLKKGKQALEDSTAKRLNEAEIAVKNACAQNDKANAIVRALENQNAEIRAEREGAKLSASESLKACMEASKKEKKYLKKLLAWEKQKAKLQDEITAEKEKIKALNSALAQITQDEKETEAKWKQEQRAKEQTLAQVEEEQRTKEATEAHNKRRLETLRLKIEIDFQRHKDDHQRLEQELSRLKASSNPDSSHLSNNSGWKSEKSRGEDIAKLLEELDKLEGSTDNEANTDRECIMCMKDEVSVVFLPCAHQIVCGSCSDSFFNANDGNKVICPCCRSVVQQKIRIFGATS